MTSPAVFCLSVQLRSNGNQSQQSKKLDNSTQSQRSQTSGGTLRALTTPHPLTENTSSPQTLAGESNGNHIIFLRGIRSDNGKIILTRDDNIRIQDGVLTVTNLNKTDGLVTGNERITGEKNDNEQKSVGHVLYNQSPELSIGDVVIPTGSGRRVNGTPVLFYTSTSGTVSGASDLTNGNVAFVSNAEDLQQIGEFAADQKSQNLSEKAPEVEQKVVTTPLGSDGEPIKLPENLESLPKADHFPIQRHRWNTNEEIAAILISFERHAEWQSKEVRIRPKSGSMLLYSRKKVRYRRDGYCWKKRKDGKTTREDHMKLKVQGTECIYGCYVHSAILPTFHRRCYWLLQNPDIVLVHYLNVPYPDDNKLSCITPSLALWADKKEWTKEELVSQLKPMFFSEDEPDINNELEISTAETVEAIVSQLMEKQRAARQAALVKQLECGCPDSTCAQDGKQCSHPMRRIRGAGAEVAGAGTGVGGAPGVKVREAREDSNQVSSTTGSAGMLLSSNTHSPRIYTREHRGHHQTSSHQSTATSTPPLVLSLSQIQGGGGLLILNSSANTSTHSGTHQSLVSPVAVTSFVCNTNNNLRGQHLSSSKKGQTLVLKQEAMDTNTSNCLHSNDSINKMDITNGNVSELYEGLTFGRHEKHVHQSSNGNEIINMSSTHSTPSKRMDTTDDTIHLKQQNFCGETVVLLGTESVNKNDINNGFFNETLDLSHEDIQRTLSANMPMCASELEQTGNHNSNGNGRNSVIPSKQVVEEVGQDTGVIVSEMNPMDFMNGTGIVVSPTHVVDDDVFVNLDAFDMLGEFPELEVLEHGAPGGLLDVAASECGVGANDNTPNGEKNVDQQSPHMDYREGTANITDYSPEWAYPEGGVKVLVTGPWYSTTSPYTVLFDTFPVPTTLVQSGVLRCYCPAHEAGLATLQVACEGFVISNSVMFEYKVPPHEEAGAGATTDTKVERSAGGDNLLRFTLLQRLEAMDDRLQIKQEPDANDGVEDSALFTHPSFEDRLVSYCQTLTSRHWRHVDDVLVAHFSSHRGMTLLHLAASLGYSKLVAAMLQWRSENSSLMLDTEVDALSQDEDGFTPLMLACARGHLETALMLYRWNHTALNIRNVSSQTALECARANNNFEIAREIERQENRREQSLMLMNSLESSLNSPAPISPASSIVSISSIASTSKSHDGVFLRPGAVSSGNGNSSGFGRFSVGSHTLSPGGSESSGVHHKGGTQKMVKRPSVDSGINISSDSLPSLRSRSSKSGRDIPKLSRFDRSMSLPLNSPLSVTDNCFESSIADITRLSPVRRMDFTLSEGPRPASPLIDVEALSDDDDNEPQQNGVGEQDVRVLTLAEQIIAAMPDRIKNESEDMQLDNSPKPSDTLSVGDSLSDVFMEPLLDQSSSSFENAEFNFEFSDHNYRYYDVGTPCSSLSPASSSCLQSPCSFTLDSPSPPPTTADFCEFFQASGSVFEKDFSNLTLSDKEQRELYEAAKIIQKAYRSYKGRQHNQMNHSQHQQQDQGDKERAAAVLIQNYYRRYKQYAYFKQMTRAAMVIQSGYRSYCEHKRFKKSQEAAVCIQNYYRNYREQGGRSSREGTPASSGLKRTYSQRRQHQAARKIQQFMRQSKNKLQRERAERERQGVLPPLAAPQRSPCLVGRTSMADQRRAVPGAPATRISSAGLSTADNGGYAERKMDTSDFVSEVTGRGESSSQH